MLSGPAAIPPKHATLADALLEASQSRTGITFVDLAERETFLSYEELWRRAQSVAGALQRMGIRPGDRVALILPTSPSFLDALFGTVLAGAVPVPLYPPLRLGRLPEYHASTARMLERVQARLILADERVRRILGQTVERARPALGCHTVEPLRSSGEQPSWVSRDPDGLAIVQFSSGSTRDPKPVALSHANILWQCSTLRMLLPEESRFSHRGVSWLPLYHDMGLVGFLLSAVDYPAPLTLIAPEHFLARPGLWLRTIARHRATISAAPNFAYGLCLKRVRDEELSGLDLSSWALATSGAETVSPELMRRFAERLAPFGLDPGSLRPVYGLAEATLAVTFTPKRASLRTRALDSAALALRGEVKDGLREIASVGAPVPGVELDVRGEDGAALGEGRLGRIFVRGPSVASGYFQARGEPSPADGWLDTGDLGFTWDGELYIAGRAKDVIIIRGANHSAQEFEECVQSVPGVRAGCVVALPFHPPDGCGEELLILAEREAGYVGDFREAIRREVAERTGISPHAVESLEPGTLPRTSSGKLRRAEALTRYLSGTLAPPSPVNAATLAAETVKSAMAFFRARLP